MCPKQTDYDVGWIWFRLDPCPCFCTLYAVLIGTRVLSNSSVLSMAEPLLKTHALPTWTQRASDPWITILYREESVIECGLSPEPPIARGGFSDSKLIAGTSQ